MRIAQKDKRKLNIRLKNRLSLILRANFVKAPLILLISVSVWISQDAIARVQNNTAKIEVVTQPMSIEYEVSKVDPYSKESLKKPVPEPAPNMAKQISGHISVALQNLKSKSNSGIRRTYNKNPLPDTEMFHLKQAYMIDPGKHDQNPAMEQIKGEINSASQKIASETIIDNVKVFKAIKHGFDFKLDFTRLFDSSSETNKASAEAAYHSKSADGVRYGLILKDIVPQEDPQHYRAAIGPQPEDEILSAKQADVIWTIGPINENENKKIFNTRPDIIESAVSIESPKKTEKGLTWPKPSFNGNMKLNNTNVNNIAKNSDFFSGLLITIRQEQGFYELFAQIDPKFKANSAEHQLTVPIYKEFSVERRYNDKLDIIKTSANNILMNKDAPRLSMHYLHMEKQYITEANCKVNNYNLSIRAQSAAKENPNKKKRDHLVERYELGLNKNF